MSPPDENKIYTILNKLNARLTATETRQEERHEVNQRDMDVVKGFADVIEKHCRAITRLQTHKSIQWFFIGGISIAIIGLAIRNW